MLPEICRICDQFGACSKRYGNVSKGEKIYCPDGTTCFASEPFKAVDFRWLRM